MIFESNQLYHIYNRGNNKQPIFYNRDNYLFFLKKARKGLFQYVEFLAYSLMPNHFHFLVYTKEDLSKNELNNAIAILLRSYTRAINIQEDKVGSLFQQKT